jgi:hypothetical protein
VESIGPVAGAPVRSGVAALLWPRSARKGRAAFFCEGSARIATEHSPCLFGGRSTSLNTVEIGPTGFGCDLKVPPAKDESIPLAYSHHSASEILETMSYSGSFELEGEFPKNCNGNAEEHTAVLEGEL